METMLPLPVGKLLTITFWLDSERISTPAVVRSCDGGVGMGIEFTGLDEQTKERLQRRSRPWQRSRRPPRTHQGAG